MEKMLSWLHYKEECHGPVVFWVATLVFLLASILILALLFAAVGFAMWVSPYFAALLTLGIVGYLIYQHT